MERRKEGVIQETGFNTKQEWLPNLQTPVQNENSSSSVQKCRFQDSAVEH